MLYNPENAELMYMGFEPEMPSPEEFDEWWNNWSEEDNEFDPISDDAVYYDYWE